MMEKTQNISFTEYQKIFNLALKRRICKAELMDDLSFIFYLEQKTKDEFTSKIKTSDFWSLWQGDDLIFDTFYDGDDKKKLQCFLNNYQFKNIDLVQFPIVDERQTVSIFFQDGTNLLIEQTKNVFVDVTVDEDFYYYFDGYYFKRKTPEVFSGVC